MRLFVYGTLGPGEEAWHLVAPHASGRERAAVPGRLYDTGRGYPAAVFDADAGAVVHGWRCTLVGAPLAQLDRYEGDEYERIQVACTDGEVAHAYQWVAALTGCRPVEDGTWVAPR